MGGDYRPKPKEAFAYTEWPSMMGRIDDRSVELFARFATYRGQIRDFAIMLWVVEKEDTRFEVETVDCCDSQLHRHRLARSNPHDRQADRHVIRELYRGDEEIVNSEFDVQYDLMANNWESMVRRWDRG